MESGALLQTVRTYAPAPLPLGFVGRFIHLQNVWCHFGIGSPKFTANRVPHPKGVTLLALFQSSLPVCSGFSHLFPCGAQKLQATDPTHSPERESRASLGHVPAHVSHEVDPCARLVCLDMYSKHTSLIQPVSAGWRHLADLGTANLKKI